LVLLFGGGLTAVSQKEGFILLGEGAQSNSVSDYHARILRITKDGVPLRDIDFKDLETGYTAMGLPFRMTVQSVCENCRPAPVRDTGNRKGFAAQIMLANALPEKEAETNLAGATFEIAGVNQEFDGIYA